MTAPLASRTRRTALATTLATTLSAAALAATALLGAAPALAQAYPNKPVKFIVPFAPGSATDQLARAFGAKVSESHWQSFELASPGQLSAEEYDAFLRDTVNFLEYAGEPYKAKRQSLGVWVILFLLVFTGFAYLLKREYWKDVK